MYNDVYPSEFADKIAIAPPPTVDVPNSISVGGGTGTAVVKYGEHAELTAEFMSWAKLSKEGNV